MKKTILFALATSSLLLTSCNKDDDSSSTNNGGGDPVEETSNLLHKWECTGISVEGTGNITGAPVGSFTGVGYDLSDFGVNFIESGSTLTKEGDYSLDVDLNSSSVPITQYNLEDQVIFPTGVYTINSDGTITVTSAGVADVNMTVLNNTDTELSLKVGLDLEYQIPSLSSTVSLPTQATFTFKVND